MVNCDDLTFDGVFNGDATDGQLTFSADSTDYENGVVTPGDYVVTITGTAVTSSDTKTATFTISMVDPCDPPVSITSPGLTDQVYTITDTNAADYTHPAFVSNPTYCPIDYSYSETKLIAGDSAITNVANPFSFLYSKDLAPLDQTQIVTVTATSNSIYGTTNTKVVEDDTFDLTFLNPCLDTEFVTLTATTQTNPPTDTYTSTDIEFTYIPFTVMPSFCEITVECVTVAGPSNVLTC